MNPREGDSKTAMPDLDLDRQTAQDVAAYFYASSQQLSVALQPIAPN
jgi:hypothetical protein